MQQLRKTQSAGRAGEALKEYKIFLLSGKLRNYGQWDFPNLTTSLLNDFPKLKRRAMVMSVNINGRQIIHQKAEVLRESIRGTAVCFAPYAAFWGSFNFHHLPDTTTMGPADQHFQKALGIDQRH